MTKQTDIRKLDFKNVIKEDTIYMSQPISLLHGNPYFSNMWVCLGLKTCELFLCFGGIVFLFYVVMYCFEFFCFLCFNW